MSMKVAEGDAVAANQVVAEIDPRPFEDQRRQAVAAQNQAKAALENARLNLARTERLLEKGIASGKEVEDARAQLATSEAGVEEAAAALDTADRQLSRTHVASPIAGQVVKRLVNVGEQVDGTAAQPLIGSPTWTAWSSGQTFLPSTCATCASASRPLSPRTRIPTAASPER
jgi:multidrug efflux system membrane fusion protein